MGTEKIAKLFEGPNGEPINAHPLSDYFSKRAYMTAQTVAEADKLSPMTDTQKTVAWGSDLVGNIALLAAATRIGGLRGGFTGLGYFGARGRDASIPESAKSGLISAAMAEVYARTDALPLRYRAPAIFGATYQIEKAGGATDSQALKAAATNAGLVVSMTGAGRAAEQLRPSGSGGVEVPQTTEGGRAEATTSPDSESAAPQPAHAEAAIPTAELDNQIAQARAESDAASDRAHSLYDKNREAQSLEYEQASKVANDALRQLLRLQAENYFREGNIPNPDAKSIFDDDGKFYSEQYPDIAQHYGFDAKGRPIPGYVPPDSTLIQPPVSEPLDHHSNYQPRDESGQFKEGPAIRPGDRVTVKGGMHDGAEGEVISSDADAVQVKDDRGGTLNVRRDRVVPMETIEPPVSVPIKHSTTTEPAEEMLQPPSSIPINGRQSSQAPTAEEMLEPPTSVPIASQREGARASQPEVVAAERVKAEAEPTPTDIPPHVRDEIGRITGQPSSTPTEAAVGEPPPHVREEIARITGTANAVTESERAGRGLAPVEKQAYAAMGDSYLRGREAVEQGSTDPRSLAQLVADNPRPLTSDEVGALGYDRARLKVEHRETLKAISDAVDRGDKEAVAAGRARLERVEKDLDSNDQALQKGGREQSAAFNARKMIVRDDYDLDTLVRRAKAAKGSDLTPAERGQFEALSRRLEEAERKVAERDEQLSKMQAARATRKLVADTSGEARIEARRQRRTTTKQELDEQFADLRAQFAQARAEIKSTVQPSGLAGLDPEGKLTGLVIQMAKNRARAGVVTAEGLVDEIYNALKDHVEGLTRRDVRDAISGYGKTAEMSQDPAAKNLRDLKQQMRLVSAIEDAESGQKPLRSGLQREPQSAEARRLHTELYDKMKAAGLVESRRLIGPKLSEGVGHKEGPRLTEAPLQGPRDWLPAAKQRLQSRIVELEGKIARGDFTKPEPRPPVVYDREGNALKARVESLKRQIDEEIRKRETKGPLDYLVKWKRFAVLAHPTTFAKLAVAAAGRMVQTPIEEVTGGVLSKMPGVSKIAERAPREGGFNLRAEVNAISQLWQSDSFRAMLDNLKVGRDDLDVLYGDKKAETEFSNLPGRGHAAVKVIPKRAEFFRSFEKRLAFAARQGSDISDPEVQAGVAMEAYADAKRAIFMQPNMLSDGFNSAMRWLERRGVSGKTVAALSRFEVPITKVPVNFVGETLSLDPVVGASKGLVRLAASGYREGGVRGAAKTTLMLDLSALKPEEADYVLRAWKKGLGIGLGMTVLGFLRPQNFGGYYQPGEKRDESDAQVGEIVVVGHHIPRWATHVPLLEAAQFGATIRRVMDAVAQKEMRSPKDRSPVAEGLFAAGRGLAEEIPFFSLPKQISRATEGGEKGLEKFGGEQVKSLIPGLVQDAAEYRDRDMKGQPVKRYPQGFTDAVKEGIPGLREQVPSSKLEPGFQHGVKPSDSVKAEMERLNVPAPDAGEKMTIGGREFKLTPEQQQKYREALKAAAYPKLDALFSNPAYQPLSDDYKKMRVGKIIAEARAPVEAQMKAELIPESRRLQIEARRAASKAARETDVGRELKRDAAREERRRRRYGLQ